MSGPISKVAETGGGVVTRTWAGLTGAGGGVRPRLVLAGGSGFLGQVLGRYFHDAGWEIVILTRHPKPSNNGFRQVLWDGERLGPWQNELNGAYGVVNLSGVSVNCRYTAKNRRLIMDSRVRPTRVLARAIQNCPQPPAVWLNSSTATIYKHSFDCPMDEAGEVGATPEAADAFSVEVAKAWESACEEAVLPRTRQVVLRLAMVLGTGKNSVFPVLCRLVQFGLGGRMGSGRQYVSWIHELDFCRAIEWIVQHPELSGPVNLSSAQPLPNAEMMRQIRLAYGRVVGLPASRWMLEIGAFLLRTETELIIKSRYVVPGKLTRSGFQFQFKTMPEAFEHLLDDLRFGSDKKRTPAAAECLKAKS